MNKVIMNKCITRKVKPVCALRTEFVSKQTLNICLYAEKQNLEFLAHGKTSRCAFIIICKYLVSIVV